MEILEQTLREAGAQGIRLEMVGGIPVWEASPVVKHQSASFRIQKSIGPTTDSGCACVHYADIWVRFSDGSLKRPDIAVFCREPDERSTAVTLLPEAVVEILSDDYAAKDLEIGIPFYRRMGVKDIVVLDPDTNAVLHYQNGQAAHVLTSPTEITFACGCRCTV